MFVLARQKLMSYILVVGNKGKTINKMTDGLVEVGVDAMEVEVMGNRYALYHPHVYNIKSNSIYYFMKICVLL